MVVNPKQIAELLYEDIDGIENSIFPIEYNNSNESTTINIQKSTEVIHLENNYQQDDKNEDNENEDIEKTS